MNDLKSSIRSDDGHSPVTISFSTSTPTNCAQNLSGLMDLSILSRVDAVRCRLDALHIQPYQS